MPARTAKRADTLLLDSVAALKAVAEPMRLRIMLEIGDERHTVKELAAALGVATTRLYYHVNILEKNGLLRVAERRLVSGIEERTYEAAATNFTVSPKAISSAVKAGVVGAITDVVRAELELALRAGGRKQVGEPGHPVPIMTLTRLALSDDDVTSLQQQLRDTIERYAGDHPAPGKTAYHGFIVAYQAPNELKITRQQRDRRRRAP